MHSVPDAHIVTPFLIRRFQAEAAIEEGNGQYYAIVQRSDGSFLDHNPGSPELAPDQMMFARDVLTLLNREIHHDGAWMMVFTNPAAAESVLLVHAEYQRMAFLFVDRDGDPQFTIDWVRGGGEERDFADVLLSGRESWGNRCEAAWQTWKVLMRDTLAPSPEQLIKRAQGQQPTLN